MKSKVVNINLAWVIGLNALVIGRAIEHIRWDPPYRAILWSEYLYKWFIEGILGYSWDDLLTDPSYSNQIQTTIKIIGVIMLILLIVFNYYHIIKKVTLFWLLIPIQISLTIIPFCIWWENGRTLGLFLEPFIQTAFIPAWYIYEKYNRKTFNNVALVIIAATFIGHGLYAIGYYPAPREFVEMFIETFFVPQLVAEKLLFAFGIFDFVFSIALFFPNQSIKKAALLYMIFWGFVTALARMTSYIYFDFFFSNLVQWIWEFLIRTPHFILPFIVYKQYYFKTDSKPSMTPVILASLLLFSSCQSTSDKVNEDAKIPSTISKTYVIKADAEAKQLIESTIINFRKVNPDFKINMEFINRKEKINNADIIVLAAPYPNDFPFSLFDTIAKFNDTIVFIKNIKNSIPLQLTIKKNEGAFSIQIPNKTAPQFYTTNEKSPDITLLFDTIDGRNILNAASKKSNDYNKLIEWVLLEKNAFTWTSIKQYRQKKESLSIVPVHKKNKPYTIIREVLILKEKNKLLSDTLFAKFQKTLN